MDAKDCKARAAALAEESRVALRSSVVDGPKHTGVMDTEDDEDEGGMDGSAGSQSPTTESVPDGPGSVPGGADPAPEVANPTAGEKDAQPTTGTEEPPRGGLEEAMVTNGPTG